MCCANSSTHTKMSSYTVRRSPRLAEKMATARQALRRSPRLANLKPQTFVDSQRQTTRQTSKKASKQASKQAQNQTTQFVYDEAFANDMIHTCKNLRKYFMRFVSLFEQTLNTTDVYDGQKAEICLLVRLSMLAQQYPNTYLATVFGVDVDTNDGEVKVAE